MTNQLLANFLFTNAGVPIEGATVDLLARNTTTPVLATTTTDANGYWAFSHATEGRFDVRITNGSSVRWHMYDASAQFTALEVADFRIRNPGDTFEYDIGPGGLLAPNVPARPHPASGAGAVVQRWVGWGGWWGGGGGGGGCGCGSPQPLGP